MRKPPSVFLLLTLAYVVSGRLGLMLAVPPGYATATFPPAGIAVAAMLIAGRATLPWTFLGSFMLNVWTGYAVAQRLDPGVGAAALIIAAASTVQAALAGGAMRRWLGVPTPLDNSRDLARFFALSPLCCMTSATLSLSGLSVLGVIAPSALVRSWVTWWIGDTLGVLLVLPLVLVLAGEPRALWRRRSLSVAAPMLLFAALFVAIFAWSTTWGSEQMLLESWGVLAAGVFSTGLLGALLMIGTGRAHRTERLVAERTRDLAASNERLRVALDELHATEANFRALYNKAPAPQHSLDAAGNIIGVSDYWLQLMGYAREEVIGQPITAFLSPSSAECCRRSRPVFLARGEETAQEFEFVKRSGEIVEALVSRRVERDMDGNVVRTLGVVTDMTARRKAERERDRLFEISLDLIVIYGLNGGLRDVNPAFEAALGYRRDELIGACYIDFVHPEDRAKVQTRFERLLAGETLTLNEIRCRHRDGSWRWVSWRPMIIKEEGLIYSIGRDTTASRETEEALRQAQKMEAVGLLTGGVAHDFNNLLTVIAGNLDLLEPKVVDRPDSGPLLKAMQHAANRGERLITQLLAFSRQQTLRPETLDINALIRRFEPLIHRAIGENIEVETHLSPDLWPCTIDAVQLETALLNLATNARDAMPVGGQLTITTQNLDGPPQPPPETADAKPGPRIAVVVRDTGTGMPPEMVERAFEPFFTTKEPGKGSGLGLSQVYGFVEQSGGHVTIDSEVGQGTTVRLYLPPADRVATAAVGVGPARFDVQAERGSERILVVEDDADVLGTSAAMMTDLGYVVRTAAGPLEALEILRDVNEPIDLLFSDVMMPQMSGFELAAEAQKLRAGLKVLLTSGYSKESLSPQRVSAELPLMTKPYKQTTLAAELRALLDSR